MIPRKKIFILSGALLLATVLIFLSLFSGVDSSLPDERISLRNPSQDVTISDMMSTPSRHTVAPSAPAPLPEGAVSLSTSTGNPMTTASTDSPEALAAVQALIIANQSVSSSTGHLSRELNAIREDEKVNGNLAEREIASSILVTPNSPAAIRPAEPKEEEPVSVSSESPSLEKEDVSTPPKPASVFNSIRLEHSENANAIKAYVHSEQVVMEGSTLKMRLGERAFTDNGVEIPRNSPVYGIVSSVNGERVNVSITHINVAGNILPFAKSVYSKDALPGIYVPGNPKADAEKEITGGALDALPTSGIPSMDVAARVATAVAGSAASSGKQALSRNLRKLKVTIKTNYELYLRPSTDKK